MCSVIYVHISLKLIKSYPLVGSSLQIHVSKVLFLIAMEVFKVTKYSLFQAELWKSLYKMMHKTVSSNGAAKKNTQCGKMGEIKANVKRLSF